MMWFARRIATSLVLAWVVVTAVFLSLHLVPGDPAELLLSTEDGVPPSPAAVEELRRQLGLNRPLHIQYGHFLAGIATGDLGNSLLDGYPVAREIALRLPRTLELIVVATLLSLLIGIPAGAAAALSRGGTADRVTRAAAPLLQAMPVFVLGTVFVYIFAQWLRLVPAGGYVAFGKDPVRHVLLLAMPAMSIAIGFSVMIFRMTRAAVLDVLSQDFIRTARAKGVAPGRIVRSHVLRAALSPVATIVGMEMGVLLGGTVITEFIFNWPGLSTPLLQGIMERDYPTVSSIVLVISCLFLLINLATDLVHAVLDPRARTA